MPGLFQFFTFLYSKRKRFVYLIKCIQNRRSLWSPDIEWIIIFTISKVIIPDFGAVYILKPRFLFTFIFLVLHFYVVEVLELNPVDGTGLSILDGMELSEVKSGGYYIMCGDILFSPIRSDDWERLTKDKTLSKRVPPFIFRILYNYFCLNIHKINMSQSKKCYRLLYNKGRHRWSLSAKI